MNKKTKAGIATLAVAALATAGITLPDYSGGTRLGYLAKIGIVLGNPDTQFGYLDGGGQIAVHPDSSFSIYRSSSGVETRGYEFWTEHGGVVDSMVVSAFDTLRLTLLPGEQLTLWAKDGGWPSRSGRLTLEVAPEGGDVTCRVLERKTSYFPPYVLMTQRLSDTAPNAGWDHLNYAETSVIVLPADEDFQFAMRAVDPRYDHLLRGSSPPIRVQTYEPAPALPGPELARAAFVNGWTLRFSFSDSLNIDPATVGPETMTLLHDGVDVTPASDPAFRWGWYFDWSVTQEPGTWELVAGAVADTLGTVNASPDTVGVEP